MKAKCNDKHKLNVSIHQSPYQNLPKTTQKENWNMVLFLHVKQVLLKSFNVNSEQQSVPSNMVNQQLLLHRIDILQLIGLHLMDSSYAYLNHWAYILIYESKISPILQTIKQFTDYTRNSDDITSQDYILISLTLESYEHFQSQKY